MKIVYTGPLRLGSLTESRRQALITLGHNVVSLDQCPYVDRGSRLRRKLMTHLLLGPGIAEYNRDLLSIVEDARPDLVYIDQAAYLTRKTVLGLRSSGAHLIHYTSEWFGFRPYWYRRFVRTIDLYDAHVVTHPPSRDFLLGHGGRKVVMTTFGYDPELHVPPELSPEDRERYGCDAVFIGHWEPATETDIVALRRAGIAVRVWGPGWHRARSLVDRQAIKPVYGRDYVKAIAASRMGLCILSTWNSNRYAASRTFEIPAVGTFLLAQRTRQHQSFYEEDREAVFFDGESELTRKVRYFVEHDVERSAIAAAGHLRCTTSGYTHADRMRQILAEVA